MKIALPVLLALGIIIAFAISVIAIDSVSYPQFVQETCHTVRDSIGISHSVCK